MTAPTTTPSEDGFYEALARLHGHRCPMSILGARLGLAARAALGGTGKRRVARYHHSTCALDGIQMATQCTAGNQNLRVEPQGEHRLLLWAEGEGLGVEATLTREALDRGRRYAELRGREEELTEGSDALRALRGEMESLLRDLELAPAEALVAVRTGAPVDEPGEG